MLDSLNAEDKPIDGTLYGDNVGASEIGTGSSNGSTHEHALTNAFALSEDHLKKKRLNELRENKRKRMLRKQHSLWN